MKSIQQKVTIYAPVEDVYRALTNPFALELWTGHPAHITTVPGEEFFLFGGDITGRNIAYSENKLIQQEWYFGEQKEQSVVTIKLKPEKNKTEIVLLHTNIPEEEYESLRKGWVEYFWKPLNKYFR